MANTKQPKHIGRMTRAQVMSLKGALINEMIVYVDILGFRGLSSLHEFDFYSAVSKAIDKEMIKAKKSYGRNKEARP